MQEEILIKRSRTGTIIYFFNTDINENNYPTPTVPAIVKIDSTGNVQMELNTFDGVFLTGNSSTVLWKRSFDNEYYNTTSGMQLTPMSTPNGLKNTFIYDTIPNDKNFTVSPTSALPNPNYISGRTFSQTYDSPISDLNSNTIRNRFEQSMNNLFTAGTKSYVFFEKTEIDDFYANIKLERTFDVLNTLNIYNKVTGEIPIRESKTGVVFGKLEAIQKISDSNGNSIRIPLRNVPIGIFNPSVEFQTPNEQDSEGNRIRLNYRPLTTNEDTYPTDPECLSWYFNSESAVFDNTFLKPSPLDGVNPHPTFSGVVFTNENGEFFLHNVEIGTQILFFEVDLLKQGLTKDEVALNFFPYPPNYNNISIDTIPHYFYRALPIDVVPSWGISYQTGYTEVDISVNLDLRKWATYIIPPVTYAGREIDSAEYRQISKAPLTVKVRDMSKYNKKKLIEKDLKERLEVYPSKGIQMVEIQNIIDKNADQQWEWANEFSQIKDKALFYTYGYHALKLPANIYDDQANRTDMFGIPKTGIIEEKFSRGVWLCGYQLKVYLTDEERLYRTTGMEIGWNSSTTQKWYSRDHYHCNLYDNGSGLVSIYNFSNNTDVYATTIGEGIGFYPYEQAWTKNYPKRYSIPRKPTIANFTDPYTGRTYTETPVWKDGDIIPGNSYLGFAGFGFGWNANIPQYTDFATDVVGNSNGADMYKYEPVINGDCGCYANGYSYDLDSAVGKTSRVVDAEEFQRIEAGYGYFLFPTSMPRIIPYPWYYDGFHIKETDYSTPGNNQQDTIYTTETQLTFQGYGGTALRHHYHSFSLKNNGKSVAMDLSLKGIGGIINDRMNIYRIINGDNRLPYATLQQIIPTWASLRIGGPTERCYSFSLYNTGEVEVKFQNSFFKPNGIKLGQNASFEGQNIVLPVGSSVYVTKRNNNDMESIAFTNLTLPGNAEFSDSDNRYTKCNYKIAISVDGPATFSSVWATGGIHNIDGCDVDFNATATHADIYWIVDTDPVQGAKQWNIYSDSSGDASNNCNNSLSNMLGITQWGANYNHTISWWKVFASQTPPTCVNPD